MKIKIVLFASLRESLGEAGLTLTLDSTISIRELIKRLAAAKGPAWGLALASEMTLTAVDQVIVPANHLLTGNCEVAFFPPVSGG